MDSKLCVDGEHDCCALAAVEARVPDTRIHHHGTILATGGDVMSGGAVGLLTGASN